ncbi:MAG: hypothetical protein SWY16_01515 [Cyanobacteriota bacterium]|nr:hypothetical protein [Cyanobacteriota bacterium]
MSPESTPNSTPNNDEFYVNYASVPPSYRRFLIRFIPLLVAGVVLFALVLSGIHDQFNLGKIQGNFELEGLLVGEPVPHLVVPRSGDVSSNVPFSRYVLSGTGKTSPKAEVLEQVGKWVKLDGIVVSRNHLSVIAARSAEPIEPPENVISTPNAGTSLGEYSLVGEIVDGKCYPGVMKPGQTKTHRGCAIRCLSGGVPAVFRVQNDRNDVMYFLLADEAGQAVNDRILDLVADPIRITGEVMQYDDMFVLQADPTAYERV